VRVARELRKAALVVERGGVIPEDVLQHEVAVLLSFLRPPAMAVHVPNGGKRSRAEGGKLKAAGALAGFPDWLILHNGRALLIELKTAVGVPSKVQLGVHQRLLACGCPVLICRSVAEVVDALRAWGVPTGFRISA
jgi:hypothetical protein